ncbi:hypothetical protein ABK040_011094 [Willaertia magna]
MPATLSKFELPTHSQDKLENFILQCIHQYKSFLKTSSLTKILKSKYSIIAIVGTVASVIYYNYLQKKKRRSLRQLQQQQEDLGQPKKLKQPSNFTKLIKLLKIALTPKQFTKAFESQVNRNKDSTEKEMTDKKYGIEPILIISLTFLVIAQSFIVNYNNSVSGDLMANLVSRNNSEFFYNMLQFLGILLLQSLFTPSINSLIETLSLRMRKNLIIDIHQKYYSNMVYYKMLNLDINSFIYESTNVKDKKKGLIEKFTISNPDQRITQDVDLFCKNISDLFLDLLNPMIDVVLYSWKLTTLIGIGGPISVVLYVFIAFGVLAVVTPNFTKMTMEVSNKEGKFRSIHNRCKQNSELIAFYGGEETERLKIEKNFSNLVDYSNFVISKNFIFGIVNDYFTKYCPHTITSLIGGLPVFFGRLRFLEKSELLGRLRYLIAVVAFEFFALGKIIELFRKLLKLSGSLNRVWLLYWVMDIIHEQSDLLANAATNKNVDKSDNIINSNSSAKSILSNHLLNQLPKGEILESDVIKFKDVVIKTPDNVTLARNLTFSVGKFDHIVITGPNGSGKSSLFRILGGLWTLHDGQMYKPQAITINNLNGDDLNSGAGGGLTKEIFYLPQKPYNIIGTLLQQIIYPDRSLKSGWTLDKLKDLMDEFHIGYLTRRLEGEFYGKYDWDLLSRGEQQKLSMVRLFYHLPKYAILDECTSCISSEEEYYLYQKCKNSGITCITISHRPALERYHVQRLVFNGRGGWKLEKIILPTNDNNINQLVNKIEEENVNYELIREDYSYRDDKEQEECVEEEELSEEEEEHH